MHEQEEESGPTDTHDLILHLARRSATATFVDAGTAGAGNLPGFRKHVIESALTVRILPLLNLSLPGIFAFSKFVMIGEATDLRLLDVKECTHVAQENTDLVVGIKVHATWCSTDAGGRDTGGPDTDGDSLMFHGNALGCHCGLAPQSMATGSSPG